MADGERMTQRAYAKSRGVNHSSISRAVAKRLIIPDDNGLIDPAQADDSWGKLRRGRDEAHEQQSEESRRNASAKVAAAASKLRLSKARFDSDAARYVDRVEALRVAAYEAEYFLAALAAAPAAHLDRFAGRAKLDPALARQILDRFVELSLVEVGDLRAEAIAAAETL